MGQPTPLRIPADSHEARLRRKWTKDISYQKLRRGVNSGNPYGTDQNVTLTYTLLMAFVHHDLL
jgi:hypothetical protein